MNNTRWVLRPGPGQFRGQGRWEAFDGTDEDWEWLRATLYLPTKEGEKPEDYE